MPSVPSVRLDRVSFAYSDSVPLLRDVSLHLAPGWTGIVGPNGAGKTTLLRLIAGELAPDAGDVRFDPGAARVVVCPQEVERPDARVDALAASGESDARRWLGLLRLEPSQLDRWPTLSPGERKRWQVGAALASDPAVLILDEPTNHLDTDARLLLAGALVRFRGVGLVVSHDRSLLNELCSDTVRFCDGSVAAWSGAYDDARRAWEAEERERRASYEKLRHEQRKLSRRLTDRRNKRAKAQAKMRTSLRMAGPKDNDARSRFKQSRRRSAEVALGWEVHKVRAQLGRVDEKLDEFRFRKGPGRSLSVDWQPAPVPELFGVERRDIGVADRVLLRDVSLSVRRDTRVRIAGPNGAGKTTLLGVLRASAHIPDDRFLYLPQELTPDDAIRLLDDVRALDAEERGRVLGIVAALGVDPEPLLASQRPSPGEARKLRMAYGLGRRAWALVLDEPTNHLDLPSIERLEEALIDYPGALVLVTHDDALARRCTDQVWELAGERVSVRSGV